MGNGVLNKMRQIARRSLLTGAVGAGAAAMADTTRTESKKAPKARPKPEELDRAAARPVLKTDGLTSPVIIESIRLLKKDKDYIVHVRSKDGAEGVALTNPPRAEYLDQVLKQLIIPFFIGKDARDLEKLLRGLYRFNSNYKMYGLALWCPQAWVEFAILDMLGRIANKPMGAMLGDIVRSEVPYYVASGRRDTTPEQEIDYLRQLLAESGAKSLKFRVGGRMSENEDAMPMRTEKLIPLVRKTFGDAMDIHADANSSYDPKEAIRVGPPAGGHQGGALRGTLRVRPLRRNEDGGRRLARASSVRRTGSQPVAFSLDDRQPWRRHSAARSVLLRRADPLHQSGAHGGGGGHADGAAPFRRIRIRLHAAICFLRAESGQVPGIQAGNRKVRKLVRPPDPGEGREDEHP